MPSWKQTSCLRNCKEQKSICQNTFLFGLYIMNQAASRHAFQRPISCFTSQGLFLDALFSFLPFCRQSYCNVNYRPSWSAWESMSKLLKLLTTTSFLSNLFVQLELEQKGLKTASTVTCCCLLCKRWTRLQIFASLFLRSVLSLKNHDPLRKILKKWPQTD